jgi:hypothetical protein
MALKDWKKILQDKERIEWKLKKASEYVIQINLITYPNKMHEVLIGRKWDSARIRQLFFTKPEALKFAKSYMKTH